ncbi:hypothetical protein C3488_25765 [Streptomyces sp. Ru72]|nr:hypothetical protein C3488_25765 [Streptomyces sp. Ru72]
MPPVPGTGCVESSGPGSPGTSGTPGTPGTSGTPETPGSPGTVSPGTGASLPWVLSLVSVMFL